MTNIIHVMQASATVSSARHVQNQLGILQFWPLVLWIFKMQSTFGQMLINLKNVKHWL